MQAVEDKPLDWLKALGPVLWRVARPSKVEPIAPDWSGTYREPAPGIQPLVDVYLPNAEGPIPSIMMIHGGGFVIGSRRMSSMTYLAKGLTEDGYAVVSIDYRMLFRGGRLDESLNDVMAAFAWWQSRSDIYGLDLNRVGLLGCSAGASLMMLASTRLERVWKMVGIYGAYDFEDLPGRPSTLPARMLMNTRNSEEWVERSPVRQRGASVPTLLLHGAADTLVKRRHTDKMAHSRREAGLPVATRYYGGQPHGFLQDGPRRSACAVALQDVTDFLAL